MYGSLYHAGTIQGTIYDVPTELGRCVEEWVESSTETTNHHWMKIKAKVSRENLSKTLAADNRKSTFNPRRAPTTESKLGHIGFYRRVLMSLQPDDDFLPYLSSWERRACFFSCTDRIVKKPNFSSCLWLVEKEWLWVNVFWLAVVFQQGFGQKLVVWKQNGGQESYACL